VRHVRGSLPRALRADLNNKDTSGIPRFIAPNYRGHDPSEPAVISGVEGYKLHFTTITTAFPDLRLTIEGILGVDERVAARWLAEGTHTGDLGEFPPSGVRVRLKGMSIALIRKPSVRRGALGLGHTRAAEADRGHPRHRRGSACPLLVLRCGDP
jgi:predicted ester cyclase